MTEAQKVAWDYEQGGDRSAADARRLARQRSTRSWESRRYAGYSGVVYMLSDNTTVAVYHSTAPGTNDVLVEMVCPACEDESDDGEVCTSCIDWCQEEAERAQADYDDTWRR